METVLRLGVDPRGGVRGMKAWDAAAGRTKASTLNLDSAVRSLAAAFGAFKLGQAAKDAVMMAARYETLGVVMQTVGRNAGHSGAEMLEFERGLRSTGIAAIESREALSKLIQANIDLSKSTDLARLAQDAAVIAGLNSSEAFGRLVHGIQSAEVRTLRLMGLNVNFEASYAQLAAQLGKNSNDLTELEKTQARVNAVMEKGPDIAGTYEASMDTAGKQLGSMKRQVDDLMVSLGSLVLDEFAGRVFQASGALKDMQAFVTENEVALRHLAQVAIAAGEAIAAPFVALIRILFNVGQQVGEVANALSAVARLDFVGLQQSSDRMEKNWQDMGDALNNNKAAWTNLLDTLNTVPAAMEEVGDSHGVTARRVSEDTITVTVAISDQVDALKAQIALYERSLAVQNRVRQSLTGNAMAQAQILSILQSGQATWAEEVDLLEMSADATDTFREALLKLGPAGVEAAQALLDSGLMEFSERLGEPAKRLGKDGEEAAATFKDAWVAAINVVGASLGGMASQVANIAGAFATGGPWAGVAAVIGSVMGGNNALTDFKAAEREWEKALDSFVDMFADPSKYDRMREAAEKAFEEALRTFAAGRIPLKFPGFGGEEGRARLGAFNQVLDNQGLEAAVALLEKWGIATTELTDAMQANLAVIRERNEAEVQSMRDDIAIRRLVALGRDEEAEAMRIQIRQQEEIARALELGGESLAGWMRAVHGVEAAARAAAAAERELEDARRQAADAAREATQAFGQAERAYQSFVNTVLSLTQRFANLRGDRVGSLKAGQAMERFNLPDDTSDTVRELINVVQKAELAELEYQINVQGLNESMQQDLALISAAAETQIEAIRKASQAQITALEAQTKAVDEHLKVARAALQAQEQMVRTLSRVVQVLSDSLDQMLLGPMSPLDPISQLMESRRQFESLVSLAMGGDAAAAGGLPQAMQALLAASDAVNATGPGYVEDFERARTGMEAIRNQFAAQLTVEEKILEQLVAQTRHLQSQIDSLRLQRDAINDAAQRQIGAIRDQAEWQMAAVRDAAARQIANLNIHHTAQMAVFGTMVAGLFATLEEERALLREVKDNHREEMHRLIEVLNKLADILQAAQDAAAALQWMKDNAVNTSAGQGAGTNFVPTMRSDSPSGVTAASSGATTVVDPVVAAGVSRLVFRMDINNARLASIERNLANVLAGG